MRRRQPSARAPGWAAVPFLHQMWVKLALSSTVLLILAISFTAGLIVSFASNQLRATVQHRNEQIARRAAEEIGSFIQEAERDLSETTDILRLVERMPWVSNVLLGNHVMMSDIFETVMVVDGEGRTLLDNRLGQADLAEFSPMTQIHALYGTKYTSPVDIDSRELPGMSFVLPAGKGTALVARLSLQRIWNLIDDIEVGPGGFAYLVSEDGSLIAYPDKAAILRRQRPPRAGSPAVRQTLLVSSPVQVLGWTVFIQQPLDQAFLPIALVLRRSLLLVLLGLAMAAALGAFVARWYARSMDSLLRGTARIAEGDLDFSIPARSADEFGVLSRAFNEMVRRLRERTMALEDSERRYRNVTDSVGDIIYSVDTKGRFSFLNSRVEKIFGIPREELLGKTVAELAAERAPWRLGPQAPAPLAGEKSRLPHEITLITPGGGEVILELESERTVSPDGTVEVHGVARDITQRKRMEEKLRRSERLAALGEIISKVAHELRNAVAGITASMELVRTRGHATGGLVEELDRVLSEAARAQGIVQGLLGSSSRPSVPRQPCSLNEAISSVVELRKGRWHALGIKSVLHLSPGISPVMAAPDQLLQVFHNIVDNAERALETFGKPGGERTIRIRSWSENGRVYAEVADTGPGIAEEHLGRVFDPFYTTRRESGGSGLGLAVCLGIVEGFGGDIAVRSRPGEGAAFTIELPAVEAHRAETADSPQPALAGRRILVAEDERAIRDFVHDYLESLDCVVDCAANGQEAMTFLSRNSAYDLVISDFRMPDRDGRQLYEWISAARPWLLKRLIYITGDSNNAVTKAFLESTGVPYLLKPVIASRLVEETRRALCRGGPRR